MADETTDETSGGGTIPGTYAGPSDASLAGPGDEHAREGIINEPDDETLAKREAATQAAEVQAPAPDVQQTPDGDAVDYQHDGDADAPQTHEAPGTPGTTV